MKIRFPIFTLAIVLSLGPSVSQAETPGTGPLAEVNGEAVTAEHLDRAATGAWTGCVAVARRSARVIPEGIEQYLGAEGIFARTWSTGAMAFWMTIMLAVYLILSYL